MNFSAICLCSLQRPLPVTDSGGPAAKMYCTVVHWTALHCSPLHCTALHCTTLLHCSLLHCTALHCTLLLHCSPLHCTALHCTALHYCTAHHCNELCFTALQFTALHLLEIVADCQNCFRLSIQLKTENAVADLQDSCRLLRKFQTVKTVTVIQSFNHSVTQSVSQTGMLYEFPQPSYFNI